MVVLVFLSSFLALNQDRHIKIGLLFNKLSKNGKTLLTVINNIIIFIFLWIILIKGLNILPGQFHSTIPTMSKKITMGWFYLGIPLGCMLMILEISRQSYKKLRDAKIIQDFVNISLKEKSIIFSLTLLFLLSPILLHLGFAPNINVTTLLLLICFLSSVLMGIPVAICLGVSGLIFIYGLDISSSAIPTLIFGGISPFALMAIPMFILTGIIVQKVGVLDSLVNLSDAIVGYIPGGLAHTNILSSMFFAGVSGAALADTAAVGSMLIPPMKKQGFDSEFSAAVTAASSVVGPIIPPSVGMIIYAYIAPGNLSVGQLFLGGAVPGIIIGVAMMVLTYFISVRRNYPVNKKTFSLKILLKSFMEGIPGLLFPVIILGGIIFGIFTPTEAGSIAAAYGLILGIIYTKKLNFKILFDSFLETCQMSAIVFFLMGNARLVNYVLTMNRTSDSLGNFLQSLTNSPYIFIILSMFVLVLIGFVLEGVAIMMLLVPIFAPIAISYGIEPYHYAILFVMTIQIALLTPPVALGLFISTQIAGTTIEKTFKDVLPFLVLIFSVILLVVFVPQLITWLPNLLIK